MSVVTVRVVTLKQSKQTSLQSRQQEGDRGLNT